jgi:hypothetical protein
MLLLCENNDNAAQDKDQNPANLFLGHRKFDSDSNIIPTGRILSETKPSDCWDLYFSTSFLESEHSSDIIHILIKRITR